ncbi:MAG: PRC-barrel domain-containing protein [Thermoplasmata archaeon]
MLATDFKDLPVYTNRGEFLGKVDDVIIDFDKNVIHGVFLSKTSEKLVKNGEPMSIPLNYIKAMGDAIILKAFPNLTR